MEVVSAGGPRFVVAALLVLGVSACGEEARTDRAGTGGTTTAPGGTTAAPAEPAEATQYLWPVDALSDIGGHSTEVGGDPEVVSDDAIGSAVMFDGDGDRLLVDDNPLDGASEFTIEIVFKPNDAYPDNPEPRFFHIESAENANRRLTIELRLDASQQWYLDAFIKAEDSQLTLIDDSLTHPVAAWHHAAVTHEDGTFTSYVNGTQELSGAVSYLPIPSSAASSIGARMNEVNWFNGAIAYVAITHEALAPSEFAILDLIQI